jgi:hypothetical protein
MVREEHVFSMTFYTDHELVTAKIAMGTFGIQGDFELRSAFGTYEFE